jgi:hypothetical protein
MTNPKYTRLYALLDRSGSMFQIKADTEGGFNSYIKEQKKVPGSCDVTLVQFDAPNFRTFYAFPTDKPSAEDEEDWYLAVYRNKPIREVPKLTLLPRGTTALYDALGRLIQEAGQELSDLPEDARPGAVEVLVLTDGHENSSQEWTAAKVREAVERQKNVYSWRFTFLGSNQDAILTGTSLGFDAGSSLTYTGENVGQAFAAAATSSGIYRSAVASGATYADATSLSVFTDEDRVKSVSSPSQSK